MTSIALQRLVASTLLGLPLWLGLMGCSSAPQRPALYPNPHYQQMGRSAANRDIEHCMTQARYHGVRENKDGAAGKKAVKGAAIGGTSAGAWGLVTGDAGERAAAGAAAGASAGLVSGAFESTETSPVFKGFVQRCLQDLGYQVIGWQ